MILDQFLSHLCDFGEAGSCDDVYSFGIIPRTNHKHLHDLWE